MRVGRTVRSFHIERTRKEHFMPIIGANITRETHIMPDEANSIRSLIAISPLTARLIIVATNTPT
jgi:hypothetical protein